MRVKRLHAVAVVDHDVVAPAAVPAIAGAYDLAAVGGVDGAAVACAYIGAAVVFILSGNGVDTRTLTAGYVSAVGRPDKIAGADRAAAAVTAGASAVVIIPVGFFLSLLLLVELLHLGLNLRLKCGLLAVKLAEDGGIVVDLGLERGDDRRSLSDVYLKLIFKLSALDLVLLELGLRFLVLGFDRLKIGDRLLVRFLKLLVALHYIADIIDKAQKFADAVCAEEDFKVVVSAAFLHGTHTLLVLFKLLIGGFLCLVDLLGLALDERIVQLYLFLKIHDLLIGQSQLAVKSGLELDLSILLVLEGVNCRFIACRLLGKGGLFAFKVVYLGLRHLCGSGCRDKADKQACRHDERKHEREYWFQELLLHINLHSSSTDHILTCTLYTICQALC